MRSSVSAESRSLHHLKLNIHLWVFDALHSIVQLIRFWLQPHDNFAGAADHDTMSMGSSCKLSAKICCQPASTSVRRETNTRSHTLVNIHQDNL